MYNFINIVFRLILLRIINGQLMYLGHTFISLLDRPLYNEKILFYSLISLRIILECVKYWNLLIYNIQTVSLIHKFTVHRELDSKEIVSFIQIMYFAIHPSLIHYPQDSAPLALSQEPSSFHQCSFWFLYAFKDSSSHKLETMYIPYIMEYDNL